MPLKQRHLRIVDGAKTEYRYFEFYKCGFLKLASCKTEKIINDFDLNKPDDIKRLNEMGFELSVRERP